MKDSINFFAETKFRGMRQKFGLKTDDRRRHVYVIGKTGMGKTNLLENMIYSDIINGHGVCYVDPHGDTAERIINFIPSNRINDVIYFNPADMEYPISFNVLESVDPTHKHLVASGLVGVFKKIWADSWGPRLEYILRNCLLALLDHPDSTLLGVTRILVDKEYRKKVINNVKDPVVKSFWLDEFTKFNDRTLAEVISPIQNKVGQFLSTALIRNIVGQVKSTINFRDIMDTRKILILNLSKGRIGEDASSLLGAMMITKIQLAAMSRVDIREEDRKDFYLYVDEFQNFATESFASILSEARKYRLNLIIAHQYIKQLEEKVSDSVFGNVGTLISFRVGAADAEELVKEFTPFFTEEDIVNLPKFNIYLKLMIDGIASNPFNAVTLPPLSKSEGNEEKIIRVTRERYAKKRDVVEDKIMRWSGHKNDENKSSDDKKDFKEKGPNKDGRQGKYPYTCDECKQDFSLNFELDKNKPLFCKNCLEEKRKNPPQLIEERKSKKENTEVKSPEKELKLIDLSSHETVDFRNANKKKIKKDLPKQQNINKEKKEDKNRSKTIKPGEVVKL